MTDRPLKEILTADLVARWDMVLPKYLEDVEEFQKLLAKLDKKRNELLRIRDELLLRNIKIDEEISPDRPHSEPPKDSL